MVSSAFWSEIAVYTLYNYAHCSLFVHTRVYKSFQMGYFYWLSSVLGILKRGQQIKAVFFTIGSNIYIQVKYLGKRHTIRFVKDFLIKSGL